MKKVSDKLVIALITAILLWLVNSVLGVIGDPAQNVWVILFGSPTVGSNIGIAALGVATSGALPLAIVGGAVGGYLVRKAGKKLKGEG